MADINDLTQNVTLWDNSKGKNVTVSTDGSKERLDVNAQDIDEDRNRLDQGDAYVVNMEYVLSNGQTKYQSFKTPNTSTRIYLRIKAYSAQRTEIQFWEAPTGVVYQFGWTERQRNRDSSNTAAAVVQAVTSLTTAGTFIDKDSLYDPAQVMHSVEYKLAQNTEYVIAMKSYAASNLTTVKLIWYEV